MKSALIILSLCVLLGAGYLFWDREFAHDTALNQNDHVKTADETNLDPLVEVPMVSGSLIKETGPSGRYSVNASYPTLALAGHPELAKDGNTIVLSFVKNMIEEFKSDAAEPTIPDESGIGTSDFTMRFATLLVSPTIISMRFDYSIYIAGAAHPNTGARVLNYDLSKRLLLGTTDLFASSSQALPFLSEYSRDRLKEKFTDMSDEEWQSEVLGGTEPTQENFREVALTRNGLLIVFNPYQVAAYARGIAEVPVPMNDLEGILSPESLEAIRLGKENILEASPEDEVASSTDN